LSVISTTIALCPVIPTRTMMCSTIYCFWQCGATKAHSLESSLVSGFSTQLDTLYRYTALHCVMGCLVCTVCPGKHCVHCASHVTARRHLLGVPQGWLGCSLPVPQAPGTACEPPPRLIYHGLNIVLYTNIYRTWCGLLVAARLAP
jgi:hypothetical protein